MKDEENENTGDPKEIIEEAESVTDRSNILTLMDSFVDRIFQIRRTLVGVSISALVLAPISIGLSIYLIRHPSFFAVIDSENEFGILLSILLGTVIIISCILIHWSFGSRCVTCPLLQICHGSLISGLNSIKSPSSFQYLSVNFIFGTVWPRYKMTPPFFPSVCHSGQTT